MKIISLGLALSLVTLGVGVGVVLLLEQDGAWFLDGPQGGLR